MHARKKPKNYTMHDSCITSFYGTFLLFIISSLLQGHSMGALVAILKSYASEKTLGVIQNLWYRNAVHSWKTNSPGVTSFLETSEL